MKGLKKINLDKKREIEEKTLKITQNELTLKK